MPKAPLLLPSECVQMLSAYSYKGIHQVGLEKLGWSAADNGYTAIAEWFESTRLIHYLSVIDTNRARLLLRNGADLHATSHLGAAESAPAPVYRFGTARPTPLSLARQMEPITDSPADLVLRAAEPWSPANHDLFPDDARECAVQLAPLLPPLSRCSH